MSDNVTTAGFGAKTPKNIIHNALMEADDYESAVVIAIKKDGTHTSFSDSIKPEFLCRFAIIAHDLAENAEYNTFEDIQK